MIYDFEKQENKICITEVSSSYLLKLRSLRRKKNQKLLRRATSRLLGLSFKILSYCFPLPLSSFLGVASLKYLQSRLEVVLQILHMPAGVQI